VKATCAKPTALPLALAVIVGEPIEKEFIVPVATPEEAVTTGLCAKLPTPSEENVTVAPEIGLPKWSPIAAVSWMGVPSLGTEAGCARSVEPETSAAPGRTEMLG
jgi:hypothetical protein